MSALVRLSRGVCLIAAVLAVHPVALFADGPPISTEELTTTTPDNLLAQTTAPQPVTPTGDEVSEATAELLHGVWHADIAGMLQMEAQVDDIPPDELEMMTAMMAEIDIQFAFASAGEAAMMMTGMGAEETRSGSWQLGQVTGNQVMFTITEVDADTNVPSVETFTATFITTNYMTLVKGGDPQVIPFWRGVDEEPDAVIARVAASTSPDVTPPATGLTTPGSGLSAPQGGLATPQPPATTPLAGTPTSSSSATSGTALQPVPVTGLPVVLAQPSNLHGVWRADIASMLAAEAASMAPEELAMMQALMGSMVIDFEFRPDGTAQMSMSGMGQAETKSGTWRLLSITGSTIQFELIETPALGTAPSPELFTAVFDSTNNMSLSKDGDPQVIPFYRP